MFKIGDLVVVKACVESAKLMCAMGSGCIPTVWCITATIDRGTDYHEYEISGEPGTFMARHFELEPLSSVDITALAKTFFEAKKQPARP